MKTNDMLLYRSTLRVRASQIVAIHTSVYIVRGAMLIFDEFQSFNVDSDFVLRHRPQVGGYFVQYPDGYKTYIPKAAFETRFTPEYDIEESVEPIEESIAESVGQRL